MVFNFQQGFEGERGHSNVHLMRGIIYSSLTYKIRFVCQNPQLYNLLLLRYANGMSVPKRPQLVQIGMVLLDNLYICILGSPLCGTFLIQRTSLANGIGVVTGPGMKRSSKDRPRSTRLHNMDVKKMEMHYQVLQI